MPNVEGAGGHNDMAAHDHGPATEPYRAPAHWRGLSFPVAIFVIAALLIMMIPAHHYTWRAVLPAGCAVLCITAGVGVRRARTMKRAAVLTGYQVAAGIGAMLLLLIV